jgi:hypothetical protein
LPFIVRILLSFFADRRSLMMRCCTNCQATFSPQDLDREESKEMEADRKAQGLQGILFRRYRCSHCGFENIFVDLLPLPGETAEEFQRRKDDLEATARELQAEKTAVVVQEKVPPVG